jgi:alpha-galactosidase
MIGRFTRMSDAIAEFATLTNVTFQYSLCQWGWNQPWVWGRRIAQSWRNTGDIKPYWAELAAIINTASFHPEAANFFGHNDLDLLEVGNTGRGSPPGNLTYDEAKSHFTAWALLEIAAVH